MSKKSLNHSEKIIRELDLTPLAGESGYISYIATSKIMVAQGGEKLAANSSIYYLLNKKRPVNYLHWLSPDDTHFLLDGGPVHYYVFQKQGEQYVASRHLLGMDVLKGERPVLMIPGGSWKALVLPEDVEYALLATELTPQWTRNRVKIGAGQEFIENYEGKAGWATADFLRRLIGPNFEQSETVSDPVFSDGNNSNGQ